MSSWGKITSNFWTPCSISYRYWRCYYRRHYFMKTQCYFFFLPFCQWFFLNHKMTFLLLPNCAEHPSQELKTRMDWFIESRVSIFFFWLFAFCTHWIPASCIKQKIINFRILHLHRLALAFVLKQIYDHSLLCRVCPRPRPLRPLIFFNTFNIYILEVLKKK